VSVGAVTNRSARVVRRTAVQVLILLVLAAAAWWFLLATAVRHGSFDLQVYFGAVNYWAHGHGEVYDYLKPFTKYGFTYPPFAALTMLPMAILPWWAVNALSIASTVLVTLVILDWYLRPVVDRYRWTRWFTVAVAATLAAIFEPMHETVSFGQVNMLLVFLVLADFRFLIGRGSRYGGVAIGLATAVKLTPGIFVLYLLITKRYRAAVTAMASAAAATVFAMLVAPDASRVFWTDALWDTDRVGVLSFISNQSLEGIVTRRDTPHANLVWAALVVVVLAVWAWRARRAVRAGDDAAGVALTALAGCLVSPVTWVHHLVWLLPALLLMFDRSLVRRGWRRWALLGLLAVLFGVLSSRLVWVYQSHFGGVGNLGSNAYVLTSLVLLVVMPIGQPARAGDVAGPEPDSGQAAGVPDLGQVDDRTVGTPDRVAGTRSVRGEARALVEPARLPVVYQHP
jgi:alpha-1,2-mannosyltransferase